MVVWHTPGSRADNMVDHGYLARLSQLFLTLRTRAYYGFNGMPPLLSMARSHQRIQPPIRAASGSTSGQQATMRRQTALPKHIQTAGVRDQAPQGSDRVLYWNSTPEYSSTNWYIIKISYRRTHASSGNRALDMQTGRAVACAEPRAGCSQVTDICSGVERGLRLSRKPRKNRVRQRPNR